MMYLLVDYLDCIEVNTFCLSILRRFLLDAMASCVEHKVEEHIIDIEVELNNH